MKRIFQLILIASIAIGFISCSSDKDPLQYFFDADIAASKSNTAEFTITFENLSSQNEEKFSSKIFVEKLSEEMGGGLKFRIEENKNTVITFDGMNFIVKDEENKTISASTNPATAAQLSENLSASFYMIIDSRLDTAEIRKSTKGLKNLGTADVNGESCVEITQSASGHAEYNVENHYFFSKEDNLMKKYTSKITDKNKKVVQSIQFSISDLKINGKLPKDIFKQEMDTLKYQFKNLDQPHEMGGDGMHMEGDGEMPEGHGDMKGHGGMEGHGSSDQPTGSLNGAIAPDWTLLDAKGNKVTLSKLKGKVVVLDFWATWCNPCKKVMPTIQKMNDRYKAKGVVVYGINTWERADAVQFMKDNKYTYGLLLKGDDVAKKYNVEGIPTMYVINKAGKIIFTEVGATAETEGKLDAAIKSAL
jgi:thiol-disulfide isomerase/thioredoxin/outer membrane lipoprotein-sorting protein